MITTRRDALSLLMGALVDSRFSLAAPSTGVSPIQLGAQTNAWPIDAKSLDSFFGVLQQIKSVGYAGFETGYFNLVDHSSSAAEVKRRISEIELTFFAMHVAIPFTKCDPETLLPPESLFKPNAEAALNFGARNLVISGAPAKSLEEAKRKADGLIRAADFGASIGLPVLYHNHDWEFRLPNPEIEVLFDRTRHTKVEFLFDIGHAYHAGEDVLSFTSQHIDRMAAFHLRDYAEGKQVPLGQGTFPLVQFASLLRQRGWVGWLLNEEDSDGKQKLGLSVIEPAHRALETAFSIRKKQ